MMSDVSDVTTFLLQNDFPLRGKTTVRYQVVTVMVASTGIVAAAQFDQSFSPNGLNLDPI